MTIHYLTLDSSCNNNQFAVIRFPICIPNGEIITPTHTMLISKTDLPIEARKAHPFPVLNKSLLSIGTFCHHGCKEVFDEKKVPIINKGNGKILMKCRRDPLSSIYMFNLTQINNIMTEFQDPDGYFAGSVYE